MQEQLPRTARRAKYKDVSVRRPGCNLSRRQLSHIPVLRCTGTSVCNAPLINRGPDRDPFSLMRCLWDQIQTPSSTKIVRRPFSHILVNPFLFLMG
jgi:hypothetical protein